MKKDNAIIVTFHCADNYGAVFQCLALQEVLKKYFDNVQVLDYRPAALMKEYKTINTYSFASIVCSLYSLIPFLRKRYGFEKFRKENISVTEKMYFLADDFEKISAGYVFLGSDQIWNCRITGGYDLVYFGKMPYKNEQTKIISYAASLGQTDFTENEFKELSALISEVDLISVREREGFEIIKDKTDKNIEIVIDPTLLIEKKYWHSFVKSKNNGGYIFVYNLNNSVKVRKIAEQISKLTNLEIKEISGKRKMPGFKIDKAIYSASPTEFINMIANADYVVTDSFHGTAFSIIFEKDFVSVPKPERGGRIKNLLEDLKLEDRIVYELSDKIPDKKIDYEFVNERLEKIKEKSEMFICTSIDWKRDSESV